MIDIDEKIPMQIMFRNIIIDGYLFLFSSIFCDNRKPFISYLRLQDRDKLGNENPLFDLYDILPQFELRYTEILDSMIKEDYQKVEKMAFKK